MSLINRSECIKALPMLVNWFLDDDDDDSMFLSDEDSGIGNMITTVAAHWSDLRKRKHSHDDDNSSTTSKISRLKYNPMTPKTFQQLLSEVRETSRFKNDELGVCMDVGLKTQLSIVLAYYTNYCSLGDIGKKFNVGSEAAAAYCRKAAEAFQELRTKWICWPSGNLAVEVTSGFSKVAGLSKAIGVIDMLEIKRHGEETLVIQVVCDNNMCFTDVEAIWMNEPVSRDSVLKASQLYQRILNDPTMLFPNGYHLIGDSNYCLTSWLMTPFSDQNQKAGVDERHFNDALVSTLITAKATTDRLRERFPRLQCLEGAKDELYLHVLACCVMHNMCRQEELTEPQVSNMQHTPSEEAIKRRQELAKLLANSKR